MSKKCELSQLIQFLKKSPQNVDKETDWGGVSDYCSNPDSWQQFAEFNQERWLEFSTNVIRELVASKIGKLDEENDRTEFEQIYRWCAEKRKEIARELKHGSDRNRQDDYGLERKVITRNEKRYDQQARETFCVNVNGGWISQTSAVIKAVKDIIQDSGVNNNTNDMKTIVKSHYIIQKKGENLGKISFIFSTINILIPTLYDHASLCTGAVILDKDAIINGKPHNQFLAKIECTTIHDNINGNDEVKEIEIYYANNGYNIDGTPGAIKGNFELANDYYRECLKWQRASGVQELLTRIGRLQWLMAHLLLVKLGNAGIMGWIEKAIAFHHGVELGEYSQYDSRYGVISWDFKALVTPNIEDYAQWYAKEAFLYYVSEQKTYIDSTEEPIKQKFSM